MINKDYNGSLECVSHEAYDNQREAADFISGKTLSGFSLIPPSYQVIKINQVLLIFGEHTNCAFN
jgi:hypothetical protein